MKRKKNNIKLKNWFKSFVGDFKKIHLGFGGGDRPGGGTILLNSVPGNDVFSLGVRSQGTWGVALWSDGG